MGLDMYLTGERYVGEEYDFKGIEKTIVITQNGEAFPTPTSDEAPLSSIKYKLGYWRKANQIHQWFVKNVQDGEDNCKEYYVTREKLEVLQKICKHIIDTKDMNYAKENLPTQSGFFFGDTNYEEEYLYDIQSTLDIIDNALKLQEKYSLDIYYQASW